MGGGDIEVEKAVHLLISGRVQGVFYRYTAQKVALRLNVKGWIKNLPNGKVEALVIGSPSAVEAFIDWCHEGPPGAVVTDVVVEMVTPSPETEGFNITF